MHFFKASGSEGRFCGFSKDEPVTISPFPLPSFPEPFMASHAGIEEFMHVIPDGSLLPRLRRPAQFQEVNLKFSVE
jgi:hypothetical protein